MGWLKSVSRRQGSGGRTVTAAGGVPGGDRRLEVSEVNSRIMLGTLRRAAEGWVRAGVRAGSEAGTLEDLAAEQDGVREQCLPGSRLLVSRGRLTSRSSPSRQSNSMGSHRAQLTRSPLFILQQGLCRTTEGIEHAGLWV